MMNKWLKDRIPPGMSMGKLGWVFGGLLLFCVLRCLGTIWEFLGDLRDFRMILESVSYTDVLNHIDPPLKSFSAYSGRRFDLFLLCGVLFSCVSVSMCKGYFRKDSKSYYVMRRLASPREMVKRTTTLGALGCFAIWAVGLVLWGLCLWVYFGCGKGLIPEQTVAIFWRYVP